MMSLSPTNLLAVVRRQYVFKLKTNANLLMILALVQMIAIAFSLLGMSGSISTGSNIIYVNISQISNMGVLVFTLMWALVVAIYLTTPNFQDLDFAFVSNRMSSCFSNILFLGTSALLGGAGVGLAGIFLRTATYILGWGDSIIGTHFYVPPGELILGIMIGLLYVLLVSSIGYFLGSLAQMTKILIPIIPALIIGMLVMDAGNQQVHLILSAAQFFTGERSIIAFSIKTLLASGLFFIAATLLSQHREVRR